MRTQGWELSKSWKFCIDYLGLDVRTNETARSRTSGRGGDSASGRDGEEEEKRRRKPWALHSYRVTWSEPTRYRPVPLATASVYFFLKTEKEVRHTWSGYYPLLSLYLV